MAGTETSGVSRPRPSRLDFDSSLISELAGIIINDGSGPIGGADARQGLPVSMSLARFVDSLSEHRRLHAEVLHRALREVAPEFGGVIDELNAKHESLRRLVGVMSEEMENRRAENAVGVARWLMAELLSHLGNESLSEASILRALSEEQLRRLSESVMALLSPGEAESGGKGEPRALSAAS